MKIKLYIEGGGSKIPDGDFRAGWASFFKRAGLKDRMPSPVRCGSRNDAYKDFRIAVKTRKPDELPLLLVDSEGLVAAGQTVWQHLQAQDRWNRPDGTGEDDAFLMICCMETWFVADRKALAAYFGQGWRDHALPQWPQLEEVPKERVFEALDKATADCGRKRYAKGKRSFDLLGIIKPVEVEKHCPAARRLLARLRGV